MVARFDLVIRGGTIVDGTGGPTFEGDVAVSGGKIASVGRVSGSGREEIDARGRLVTPGFIDVHTHYDGQATWENHMSPSSNHGVTTVVMGNCGVGFAPCRAEDRDTLVRLMEGVEDIPEIVMTAGLPWNWESFPDYLNVLSRRAFDLDVATMVPHSPLRVFVMRERGANREVATEKELAHMTQLVAEGIEAGAFGVSTSRLITHRASDGTPIPSLDCARDELIALANGLRQAGRGVFQLVPGLDTPIDEETSIMREIVAASGRPLSFSLVQAANDPEGWRRFMQNVDNANSAGLTLRAQVFPRPIGMMFGLELSFNPLSRRPSWPQIAGLPLAQKVAALRDPEFRARILSEQDGESPLPMMNMLLGRTQEMLPLGDPPDYLPSLEKTIGARAAKLGVGVYACALDLMLEQDGQAVLYLPAANYAMGNAGAAREMMLRDNTILGLGDGGAHYGLVCDASYPTTVLSYWTRDAGQDDRISVEQAVERLAFRPARSLGMDDRGVLATGKIADLNIIDHDRMKLHPPRVKYDLPGGGRRMRQAATGYDATIKTGVITYRDGVSTGALPGSLVRSHKV